MNAARTAIIGSLLAVLAIAFLLRWSPERHGGGPSGEPLIVYCAAGLKEPVEAAARAYERECGVVVQLQYGGSGTLLANLQVAGRGDLFLAADESHLAAARAKGLVDETIPLARMVPVIAVLKGNPKGVRSLDDLLRVETALANPDAAAIGTVLRDRLRKAGTWDALEKTVRVFKPTVMDVANDVQLGTVDAGVVWDATVLQVPGLKPVTAGRVRLLERDVTRLKPALRGIGYVPQDGALFPSMSVRDHLAFALRIRRWDRAAVAARVRELASMLGIEGLLGRRPAGLSGGEAQRVALGRALASSPQVLCLDEPLSALDDETRAGMVEALRAVRQATGVTILHVTHSIEDARKLGDCLFRLRDGKIEPAEISPG